MTTALSRSWALARPLVNETPGDLDWRRVQAHPFEAWNERIHLWELDDDVVAYIWLSSPGELDWHQRSDLRPDIRARIVVEAIDWATATVSRGPSGTTDRPERLAAWVMDADEPLALMLERQGFVPSSQPELTHWYRRFDDSTPLPHPEVPRGYRLRSVRWPDDVAARVDAHRAAFAPSRMTVAKYERLMEMPHYAPDRDVVVEAPDGTVAAFALGWFDPDGGIGELEPVGTHPGHRRLGLARAANLEALWRLRAAGATDALVFSLTSNEASEALYASVGFEAITASRRWTRPMSDEVVTRP